MHSIPEVLDFSNLSAEAVKKILQQYHIRLSVDEVLTIQNDLLGRPPTYAECVLWSIQGSEHCSYKSSRAHLKKFHTTGPHVILGPKEDAGIVAIAQDAQGERYGVVISHESHNHPSQIVPYEGAATGVGGNIRDVSCMGAEVIAIANSLRFGSIERTKTQFIHDGVIAGIAGYGNPIGVPTLCGDLYYDPGYNENCLVTVVTLGIVKEKHIIHSYAPKAAADYQFILVGKPTDRSGFGGASFASGELAEEALEANKGAVQEPNAFLQRHLLKAHYALFEYLREQNLIEHVGFKDLGAGGIACATVELAEAAGFGAEVTLEQVPTSVKGLPSAVILCAETQERFMWVVPPNLVDYILRHYNETFALPEVSAGAKAAVIGRIRNDGQYVVQHHGKTIIQAKARDITQGIVHDRAYETSIKNVHEPVLPPISDFNDLLLRLLAHENIASRAPVYEKFDKQVQGRTVLEAGHADAGVMQPFNEDRYPAEIQKVGLALSVDHNPRYNRIDAYWGAVNAVVEAICNVVAVGATPLAITDCLCFGNPEKPSQMQEFVDAVQGIADACRAIHVRGVAAHPLPVVSGNVSLYNESAQGAIPPSPMISCLGVIDDISKAITYDFKKADSLLLLLGDRKDECGGSTFYQLFDQLGTRVPQPNLQQLNLEIQALYTAISQSLVLAAHDISEGGLAVALAEMSFKNNIGVHVEIPGELLIEKKLFSQTGGFVLEVAHEHFKRLREIFMQHQVSFILLGKTTETPQLKMHGVIDLPVKQAYQSWQQGLREKL